MGVFAASRSRLIFVASLAVAGWFTYSAVSGWLENRQIAHEETAARAAVQQLEEKKAYLQGVRDYASSDAYVEQEARRQLGYVRDGEIGFAVVSPPAPPGTPAPAGNWWERLFPR